MRKKLHLAQSCWPFDAAMGLLHMRKASSMALILIFGLASWLLPLPALAQSDPAAWLGRIQQQLNTLQQQAQQQAQQAERRIQAAEQVLKQSQEALVAAQASGNAMAAQTATQARDRAKAALERARNLREAARRSAERAYAASQSLQRQTIGEHPRASDALLALQTGKVSIDRAVQPPTLDAADAAVLLRSGDIVRTAAASQARFFLSDARSQLAVDESTVVTYRDEEHRTTLELLQGRLRLAIERWAKSFEVRTPTAVCAVRGTRFSVAQDNATAVTEVRVLEGTVEVRTLRTNSAAIAVSAGTRLLLHPDGRTEGPLALDSSPDELLDSIF